MLQYYFEGKVFTGGNAERNVDVSGDFMVIYMYM